MSPDLPSQARAEPPAGRVPLLDLGSHILVPIAYFDILCARAYGQVKKPPAESPPPEEKEAPVDPKVDAAFKFPHPENLKLRDHIPGYRRVNFDQPPAPPPKG